jgi:hypothetical protein
VTAAPTGDHPLAVARTTVHKPRAASGAATVNDETVTDGSS